MKKIKEIITTIVLCIGCGFYAAYEAEPEAELEPETPWQPAAEPEPSLSDQIRKGFVLKQVQRDVEDVHNNKLTIGRGELPFTLLFGLGREFQILQARDPIANPVVLQSSFVEIPKCTKIEPIFDGILGMFESIDNHSIDSIEILLSEAIRLGKLTLYINVGTSLELKSKQTIENEARAGQEPNPMSIKFKTSDDDPQVEFITFHRHFLLGAKVGLPSKIFESFVTKAQDILQRRREEIQAEEDRIDDIRNNHRRMMEGALRDAINLGGG